MLHSLPAELLRILKETPELIQAYLVGGCVRDALLSIEVNDFDVEVFGVSYPELAHVLARWGKTDLVGRSFGVVKLTVAPGRTFDFAIPRRDSKVAPGHKGFEITFDSNISPQEAAARRDFTINSLMYDPRQDQILDFFGGRADLQNRMLRHTSPAFSEDPLRVLRGMQLAARFDLKAAHETIEICRAMKSGYRELAVERVREEWFKWAARSTVPSAGLKYLAATEWIEHFPEIQAMEGTPQDPQWHPEGNVFLHTCHCCDALVKLPSWKEADDDSRIAYSLAVLTHDTGKAQTTEEVLRDDELRIVSPGHEEVSATLAESFLNRIDAPHAIIERVLPLVRNHMAHLQTVTDRSVRRLARRLEPENIAGLCLIMTADALGRPPKPPSVPQVVTDLMAKAAQLQVQARAPKSILMGRHLLQLGMKPGPDVGIILDAAYDAQLEGKFSDLNQAYQWLIEQEQLPLPNDLRLSLASIHKTQP
jgi:tRNA nucleotidyltransferase (CCA-adding enzyme)